MNATYSPCYTCVGHLSMSKPSWLIILFKHCYIIIRFVIIIDRLSYLLTYYNNINIIWLLSKIIFAKSVGEKNFYNDWISWLCSGMWFQRSRATCIKSFALTFSVRANINILNFITGWILHGLIRLHLTNYCNFIRPSWLRNSQINFAIRFIWRIALLGI